MFCDERMYEVNKKNIYENMNKSNIIYECSAEVQGNKEEETSSY